MDRWLQGWYTSMYARKPHRSLACLVEPHAAVNMGPSSTVVVRISPYSHHQAAGWHLPAHDMHARTTVIGTSSPFALTHTNPLSYHVRRGFLLAPCAVPTERKPIVVPAL